MWRMNDKKAKKLRKVARTLSQGMEERIPITSEKVKLDGTIVKQIHNYENTFRGIYRKLKLAAKH